MNGPKASDYPPAPSNANQDTSSTTRKPDDGLDGPSPCGFYVGCRGDGTPLDGNLNGPKVAPNGV